jgi:hypothetical protein
VGLRIDTTGLDAGADETALFDTSTAPGPDGESLVVNADADAACTGPGGGGPAETLYLTNTDPGATTGTPGDDTTTLYGVDVGPSGVSLTEELVLSDEPGFAHVVALAVSPDGSVVYGIDKFSDRLGTYDVASGTFTDRGVIEDAPGTTLQAATSPDGTLYVTGYGDDGLYQVDPSTPAVTDSTTIDGVDAGSPGVGGQDVAFAADGTLYLIDGKTAGDPVLYTVDPSDGATTRIASGPEFGLTGLAVRNGGTGSLVGADGDADELVELDPADGAVVDRYPLAIDHVYGDMAGTLR